MRRISELEKDLKDSRAQCAALETSLDNANRDNAQLRGQNSELEGRCDALRRKLEDAERDKRRMAGEMENFWQDRDRSDADAERARQRQVAFDDEAHEAER